MPEKRQKRKQRKNPPSDPEMVVTTSSIANENPTLSERGFEDTTTNLEIRMSKRLRDTDHSQRKILGLIENCLSRSATYQTTSWSKDVPVLWLTLREDFRTERSAMLMLLSGLKRFSLSRYL